MNEANVRGYRVALSEERVRLVLELTESDSPPTEQKLRKLADLQSAIEAFDAVLADDVPGGVYKHRNLK